MTATAETFVLRILNVVSPPVATRKRTNMLLEMTSGSLYYHLAAVHAPYSALFIQQGSSVSLQSFFLPTITASTKLTHAHVCF